MYAGFTEAAHHERLITQVGVRFNGYGVLQQSADHRSAGAAGGGEDRRCMSQAWDNEATFYKWEAKYGGMACRTRNVARFRPAGLGPRYASKTTPARCSASLVRLARRRAAPFCPLPGQATPTSRGAVGEDASETALKGVRI